MCTRATPLAQMARQKEAGLAEGKMVPTVILGSARSSSFATAFRWLVSCLAVLGFVLVVITVTPLVSWWAKLMAGPWKEPRGEVLIVLGGYLEDDGIMNEGSYLRSVYAVRVYRQGGFHDIVLSGGLAPGRSVADAMRTFLECNGVPPASIHVEPYSSSTRENALYAKPILARLPGRKVLLTSDYHMPRAYRAFRKAGIDIIPRAVPDAAKRGNSLSTRWGAFMDLSRDSVALVYYFARGWI